MSTIVIVSAAIRFAALLWSAALLRRRRDWRLAVLALAIFLSFLAQLSALVKAHEAGRALAGGGAGELPHLLVDATLLLALFVVASLFGERDRIGKTLAASEAGLRERAERDREELIRELEAKTAELERFNYIVSHDLRNPLVTIKNFLGLLKQDAAVGNTERVRRDIEYIDVAAENMRQLLEELLELFRIGRAMNPPETVPLGDLVREAIDLLAVPIIDNEVEVELTSELPVVFGDRMRLLDVFRNLLANAVKFMGDQQRPRIEVGLRRDGAQTVDPGPGQPAATIYVRDNGVGIDPRYVDKVFQLFERLNPAVEGTGIGLTLAKRIVEVHGGEMWVESDGLGHGSTFCFTLPRHQAESPR